MPEDLANQLIGSIRRIWFTSAGARTGPMMGTDTETTGVEDIEIEAIEIEVKAGRFAHLAPTADGTGIRLGSGALQPPADQPTARHWRDLTAAVPAAFDRRPRIAAIVPVDPLSCAGDEPTAREWRFDLSTGISLVCRCSGAGLDFGQVDS
jgi:hypothetical protein